MSGNREFDQIRNYWIALCYKNLGEYEKSKDYFEKTLSSKFSKEDLYYEYGQTLFALNELEKAQKYFSASLKQGYNKSFSLYYIAHINELLEKPSISKINYISIIKNKNSEPGLKQTAYLQLGDMIYSRVQNKFFPEHYVKSYIVPLWKKGRSIDEKSEVAIELDQKIDDILTKYNMHPLQLLNGKTLKKKGYNLSLSVTRTNDSNVTQANDQANSAATLFESWNTEYYVNYAHRFVFKRRWVVTPEIGISYLKYDDQLNSEVFKNDTNYFAPAIKTRYEHILFDKRAALILDLEYNYTKRDRDGLHQLSFFGKSSTFSIGEKISYFLRGDSTFKLKFKNYTSYNSSSDTSSVIFHFDQIYVRPSGNIFLFLFIYENTKGATNDLLSYSSNMLRVDYLIPNLFWGISFSPGTSISLLNSNDTSRDSETSLSYGIKAHKKLFSNYKLGLSFDKQDNTSSSQSYEYSKSTFSLSLKADF